MNQKRTIIALAVMMMAVVSMSFVMSDDSDARMTFEKIYGEGFTNTNDGTLFVPLNNDGDLDQVIDIIVTENGKELINTKVTVPAGKKYTAELRFKLEGAGTHQLMVTFLPANAFPSTTTGEHINYTTVIVDVKQSIWSNTTTYIAIAAIAILIAIAAFMKIRSAPATKPSTTFTDLERQKGREEEEERPKSSATERRRYGDSEKASKADTPPPQEKKGGTFTELEKQKKAETAKKAPEPAPKKAEPAPKKTEPAKGKSAEEPKKLKYVSSRRK